MSGKEDIDVITECCHDFVEEVIDDGCMYRGYLTTCKNCKRSYFDYANLYPSVINVQNIENAFLTLDEKEKKNKRS